MREDHWHALLVEEVFRRLETGSHGLSLDEVRRRLEKYGLNEIEAKERVSKLEIAARQVKSPIIAILIAAAVIAYVVGKVIDTLVIAVVIVLNTIIGFVQECKAEEALQALKMLAAPRLKFSDNARRGPLASR